ncbi:hypothetical protein D3C75_572580 [compost metagenome]
MIRFDIKHYRHIGVVLQEGAVAFIRLGHHIIALARFGIAAQIDDFPADNIRGVRIALFQHQRDHGGGGGFAVGARYRNALLGVQQPGQHFRTVDDGNIQFFRTLHLHIILGQRCGIDHQIRSGNMFGFMADEHVGSLLGQLFCQFLLRQV